MKSTTLTKAILFIFIVLSASCSSNKKFKIGYLVPNTQSERYNKEIAYFSEKVSELGGEALNLSAEYDDKLQIKQADDLMAQGVKVLVINCVNQNTEAAIVRNAHEKKVKVVAYDRMISNCDLDYYLSFDNEKVGKLMAEYAVKVQPEGTYVLLEGDKADMNAVLVKKGQFSVLDPYIKSGKIKILYDVFVEDWSGENAGHEMKRFLDLTGEIPNVILSGYDGMTEGALKALHNYDSTATVVSTGQDAELAACQRIMQGKQSMTVYKPLKKLAYTAAELSIKLARNEKITDVNASISNGSKNVESILLDPVLVDKDNLKSTVVADGMIKESDLYQ